MGMYRSPIDIIYGQLQKQMDDNILRVVQSYDINVDKEELIRALRYDRDQYEKGYADGHRYAMDSLVRCKDCDHYDADGQHCGFWGGCRHPGHFCDEGEKREGE